MFVLGHIHTRTVIVAPRQIYKIIVLGFHWPCLLRSTSLNTCAVSTLSSSHSSLTCIPVGDDMLELDASPGRKGWERTLETL